MKANVDLPQLTLIAITGSRDVKGRLMSGMMIRRRVKGDSRLQLVGSLGLLALFFVFILGHLLSIHCCTRGS